MRVLEWVRYFSERGKRFVVCTLVVIPAAEQAEVSTFGVHHTTYMNLPSEVREQSEKFVSMIPLPIG